MLLWHIQIILFPLPTLTGNYDCPLDLKYLRLSINIRPWWWKKFANIHRSDGGRVVVRTTYLSLVLSLIMGPPKKYNSIVKSHYLVELSLYLTDREALIVLCAFVKARRKRLQHEERVERVKTFKTRTVHFTFWLRIFVSAYVVITQITAPSMFANLCWVLLSLLVGSLIPKFHFQLMKKRLERSSGKGWT